MWVWQNVEKRFYENIMGKVNSKILWLQNFMCIFIVWFIYEVRTSQRFNEWGESIFVFDQTFSSNPYKVTHFLNEPNHKSAIVESKFC